MESGIQFTHILIKGSAKGDNRLGWFPTRNTEDQFDNVKLIHLGNSAPEVNDEIERMDMMKVWNDGDTATVVYGGRWNDGKRKPREKKSKIITHLN